MTKPAKPRKENGFTTFGINSKALNLLFEKLEGKDRERFFKILATCQKEFHYAQTELALTLLRDYFLAKFGEEREFESFKKNVVMCIYRQELEALKEDYDDKY